MKKDVLGIKIDDINIDQAVGVVLNWLKKPGKYYIVTTNPETIVMAQKDPQLKKIINNADLSIPDGTGLRLATDIVCNTSGIDLMEELIKQSLDYGFTVGFLGGEEGVAEKAAKCLRKKYPKLKISFVTDGGEISKDGEMAVEVVSSKIPNTDLLFVAFGQPKQEKWIVKNLPRIPVKVAMGVGGSLDYLSGKVQRAPLFIRKLGFEWLFRLIIQPWRFKRQLALIKYLQLIFLKG